MVLEEFKREIKKLYGKRLRDIILYGSWARGDATEDSDIDVLVILEGKSCSRERNRQDDRYNHRDQSKA